MSFDEDGFVEKIRDTPRRQLTADEHNWFSTSVWNGTCAEIRRQGIRPNLPITTAIAKRQTRRFERQLGFHPDPSKVQVIAERIASVIVSRWREHLARPKPKMSRAERKKRQTEIARQASLSKTTSRRLLATQFSDGEPGMSVSPTTVQRALVAAGMSRPWEKAALSDAGGRLAALIAAIIPYDGKRAVDLNELCFAADIVASNAGLVFEEINSACISMHIHTTTVESLRGAVWLVVSRGRKRSPNELDAWLDKVEGKRLAPRRDPFRPDQRTHAIDIPPATAGNEEADLFSVLAVATGSRNIGQWRRFVELTAPAIERGEAGDYEQIVDTEKIVTVVQSGLRLSNRTIEEAIPLIGDWIDAELDRTIARGVLSIATEMMTVLGHADEGQVVVWWAERVDYAGRVKEGAIPGRESNKVNELLAVMEPDDWILDALGPMPGFLRHGDQQTVTGKTAPSIHEADDEGDGDDFEDLSLDD